MQIMKKGLFAAVLSAAAFVGFAAHAQTIVVQGGTLIDGTGRAPIENAVVVIENGRFRTVGRMGEVAIPAGAQVIDAKGKHLLPGFLDGHCHWEDFFNELYLHLGITTCTYIAIFQDGPWALAQRDGVALGKIRGPRMWVAGQAIGGPRTETDAPDSREWRGNVIVKTPEEARAAVRKKKQDGYDLLKINEFISPDLLKVIVDEAHQLGLSVTVHSWDAVSSAEAGVDAIEHIWSVGWSSIGDVEKRHKIAADRLAGKVEAEEAAALYEVENFDKIIKTMVANKVAWTPTVAKWFRPLSPSMQRFRERENQILNDPKGDFPPTLRAVTDNTYDKLFKRFTPEQLERTKLGYEKAKEFTRRFVAAGGILKEGSDPPRGMAGLLLHQAMAMDVEAGVPPMKAIQAATLNVAKVYRKDKDFGSVEPGKVADLVLIEGDPLKDIWATQNVKMLMMDGKVVDTAFSKYKNPIPSSDAYQTLPREIAISPDVATQGSRTVVKVTGRGMWPYHVVMLNGQPLETKLTGRNQLEAVVPPEAIANAGTYRITVKSPGETYPESNPARLVVRFKP